MRRLCTGILAALLVLGLLSAGPASAKVYKMSPEERSAALKEKRAKRTKAKKSGKAEPGQDQGGWVEVKPGEKIAKKQRKSKVDEIADQAEQKGKKKSKAKKQTEEAAPQKASKKGKKSKAEAAEPEKPSKKGKKSKKDAAEESSLEKKGKKSKKDGGEEIVVERKGKKGKAARNVEPATEESAPAGKADKAEKTSGRKSRRSASQGDRRVGSDYTGSKISASSAEVHRTTPVPPAAPAANATAPAATAAPAAAPAPKAASGSKKAKADDLSVYSVSRPQGQTAVPSVRQEVQPGPIDNAKAVGSEPKAGGEGRF